MDIKVIYEPILRQTVEEVTVFDATLKKEADEMIELMKDHNGIGLSGNQVGLNKRLIVFGYHQESKEDELPEIPYQALVNPKIIKFSKEKDTLDEGCLSLPGLELPVERSSGIIVEAQDLTGRKITIKTKGIPARIIQHEIDHLNGILFTDHVKNYKKINDYQFAKIVFCGSDDFSRIILEEIINNKLNIFSVITETDKGAGRGHEIAQTEIKKFAKENSIASFQPTDKGELQFILEQLKPDLLILASYGKILPSSALEIPAYGCLNVHPSLLPKYRGATPIQSVIFNGETETGVTIMQMSPTVDAGGIISQTKYPIDKIDTSQNLRKKLAEIGARELIKAIPIYLSGQAKIISQNSEDVTTTKKLTKDMGEIDWKLPIEVIDRQIRALNPWPSTFTFMGGKRLKIIDAELKGNELYLKTVQLEGKNPADWQDFKRGYSNQLTNTDWFSKIQ